MPTITEETERLLKEFDTNRLPPRGRIYKTDGDGNRILVKDPDYYPEGKFKKVRRKSTNITPPKKKRKR